jgi:hypothetical protein
VALGKPWGEILPADFIIICENFRIEDGLLTDDCYSFSTVESPFDISCIQSAF